jgi:hypothetical protein
VAVVDVTVDVAVLVVAEVVVEVEVRVEIFNQEVQKAVREAYAPSLVTQGATAAALQVPTRALFAGAADIIGTRSTVARKPAKATMMDGVGGGEKCWALKDGRTRRNLLRSLLLYIKNRRHDRRYSRLGLGLVCGAWNR